MAFLTEEDRRYTTPEDICAHVGDEYAKYMGAIVPPIFQNSLFVRPNEGNGIANSSYSYTRMANPTVDIAERKIAALEGGDGALCFSSGMGAISSAILHFVRANCHVVLVDTAYGCTLGFVKQYLRERFNVDYTLVNGSSVDEIAAAIRPDTRLIYLESPSSLVFRMQDLDAITAIARAKGIGTVIDNTYATPLYQQPLKHGVDIVAHTASKYLGGHRHADRARAPARRQRREGGRVSGSQPESEAGVLPRLQNLSPERAVPQIHEARHRPVEFRARGQLGGGRALHRAASLLPKRLQLGRLREPVHPAGRR